MPSNYWDFFEAANSSFSSIAHFRQAFVDGKLPSIKYQHAGLQAS
jgi:hypothetical protein